MNKVTRALIVGLIVMTSIATGHKAAASATGPQPTQTATWLCCSNPDPCPGLPMCPVQ